MGAEQVLILNRLIGKGLTQKVVVKPKSERDEGAGTVYIWEKKIPGRVNRTCTCPEVGVCLAWGRKRTDVKVAGVE